jgi:hypothetical protein
MQFSDDEAAKFDRWLAKHDAEVAAEATAGSRAALEFAAAHMEDMADSLDDSITLSQVHEHLLIGMRAARRALAERRHKNST